jgi:MFS family permease
VSASPVRLGLRENAAQFSLLVAVNAFVGAMVGLERSTLPLVGREDFDLTSSAAVLSFIVAFGTAKALTNLGAGVLAQRAGRRRLLIAGWVVALPVPLLIAIAPNWGWVVAANALLGINLGMVRGRVPRSGDCLQRGVAQPQHLTVGQRVMIELHA